MLKQLFSSILVIIALHWFAGESESNSLLVSLIVVAVIAGVLLIAAVILTIIVIKLRADNKRLYIYSFVSNTTLPNIRLWFYFDVVF